MQQAPRGLRRAYAGGGAPLVLVCGFLFGCREGENPTARCRVAATADAEPEPKALPTKPSEAPVHSRGWLRPKTGQVSFFAQETKAERRRAGRITYIDSNGNPTSVSSMAEVPPANRNAIVGQAGALGRGGGYSVLSFAELPPPPKPTAKPATTTREGGPTVRDRASPARVSLYGTPWCPACKQARAYLARKGVDFRDRNIEDDTGALAEYTSYGDNKVPLIVIGETAVHGFDPRAIDQALKAGGTARTDDAP